MYYQILQRLCIAVSWKGMQEKLQIQNRKKFKWLNWNGLFKLIILTFNAFLACCIPCPFIEPD
jgi:hypothetical protein